MKFRFLIIFSIQFVAAFSQAGIPLTCTDQNVISINRPLDPSQADSKTFSYKYRFIPAKQTSHGTLIFLPGGPGEASMLWETSPLADDLDMILTDPRGLGCNEIPGEDALPAHFFNTANAATDIVAVAKVAASPNKPVFIYGASYGTVMATHAAYGFEKSTGKRLGGVILESVVGKTQSTHDGASAMIRGMRLVVSGLSDASKYVLRTQNSPYGIEPENWGNFIFDLTYIGNLVDGKNIASDMLDLALNPAADPQEAEPIRLMVSKAKRPGQTTDQNMLRITHEIRCLELSTGGAASIPMFELSDYKIFQSSNNDGKFRVPAADGCADVLKDQLFDSAQFQIRSPIYYFNRTEDTATPLKGALYHFAHQRHSKIKEFVSLEGLGHVDVLSYLSAAGCGNQVWSSIENGKSLHTALELCATKQRIKLQ